MADIKQFIIEARSRGASDDEIYDFLEQKGMLQEAQPKQDLLEKASGVGEKILGFTGGKNIAEIGGSLLSGQSLPQALRTQGGGSIGKGIAKTAGDVGQIGLNIGIAAVPPATSLRAAIGTGAILSGGVATSRGLSEGKTIVESAKGSVVPSLLGATFFGVGYGIGKLAGALTKKAPESLYQSALKQSKQDLMKEITHKAPELSKQLIERGIHGSDNKIYSQAISGLVESEKRINKLASGTVGSQKISTQTLVEPLDELSRRAQNVFGKDGAVVVENVKQTMLNKGNEITVKEALQLKRDIYKELSKSSFNVDASLSNQAEALRSVAGSLADTIAKTSKEIGDLTKSQQMWVRTARAIEGKAGMAKNNIIGLSDSILGSATIISGDVTSLVPVIGRRVLETARAKTGAAVLLNKIGKIPTDSLGKISKSAAVNILKDFRGQK